MARPRLLTFWRDNRGAAIIYLSLAMPVLVGGMGLGAETGYRYFNQRLLQHAADVSAHAGAVSLRRGGDDAAVEAAALVVATGSGFDTGVGIVPISNVPPTSGAFTGNASAVEVILRETRPRLFSALFGAEPVTIAARAVAAVTGNGANGCILALSGSAAGAVTVTGNNTATLNGCSVVSNSTSSSAISLPNAGSSLTADCLSTAGGISQNANSNVTTDSCLLTNQGATQDPYYWVQEPPSTCTGGQGRNVGQPNQTTQVTTTTTLNGYPVAYFCNGIAAKGIVNFAPGLYIISGGTVTSSGATTATFAGTGVTFFFTNTATMSFGANATLDLEAPTTGPYSGLLFFGSRTPATSTSAANHTIQGTPSSTFQGAIYMPASHVQFSGNSAATSGCTQVIANTVTLTGSSTVSADCESAGTTEIGGPIIAVVE